MFFVRLRLFNIFWLFFIIITFSVEAQKVISPLSIGKDGSLRYLPDEKGNKIPDFSYAGYAAGERPIPEAPIKVVVSPVNDDATRLIQQAIDYVAHLKPDKNGIRGAVLLEKGTFRVEGSLALKASGVVIRGSGTGEDGTILLATGKDRRNLIHILGKNDKVSGDSLMILDEYVPVGSQQFKVAQANKFKVGDKVLVHRPSKKEWITELGMTEFGGETAWLGWKPGTRDIMWDRTIISITGETVVIDAPLTTALDRQFGGARIIPYTWEGIISQTGVENLRCRSDFDETNLKDEDHCWMAIAIENAQDAWVRQVTFEHFAGSAVFVTETARRITVEDCKSLSPVSEIGGQRRYTFFTMGQQTLFQRLYSEYGYHDFAVGFLAAGPNAFVQCDAYQPYSFSGAIDSWTSGLLLDIINIDGKALGFFNREQDAHGAGWNAANSVMWQCTAAKIFCHRPPTANNWSFGAWGQFSGNGYWESVNSHVNPRSLYYAQLKERIGNGVMQRAHLLEIKTDATSSPSVEEAAALTALSVNPPVSLKEWIDLAPQRVKISTDATGAVKANTLKDKISVSVPVVEPVKIENGLLLQGNRVLTGKSQVVSWWRGDIRYYGISQAKFHITRFVPGRYGAGSTDDLNEVTDLMIRQNIVALDHNYGLWYERRRDDHERVRRQDGEVWPPFYELPFARSGKDTAWDGLSKYDLVKYNAWYWMRLKQFVDLADQKGLILLHQHYFQHNILEAGAHWADFPWRSANNINDTGFPEPPPYAGDKRIFMAGLFYDTTNVIRKELHRRYIRKCLDNFKGNQSVVHLIGAEYTGPLDFVQFWIDVIREWEHETGVDAKIGLSTTKDVQDAILSDPVRRHVIDLIDIRYWHYRSDGSLYAPEGGLNLAPRQHARLVKPGKASFDQVYRAILEYRIKFPDKAVFFSADESPELGWAVFMAGGSKASIPKVEVTDFFKKTSSMKPVAQTDQSGQYILSDLKGGMVVYNTSSQSVKVDLTSFAGWFRFLWIDPVKGTIIKEQKRAKGNKVYQFDNVAGTPAILYVSDSN